MTNIEWTDETWNPVTGCTKISAGCKNCYAEAMHHRLSAMEQEKYATSFAQVVCHENMLTKRFGKRGKKVFVNSMSDLFHKDVPFSFIDKVFENIFNQPQHIFQILTKRPKRMQDYVLHSALANNSETFFDNRNNIWFGVTAENQEAADERVPIFRTNLVSTFFLSIEPLLSEINLSAYLNSVDWVIAGCESGSGKRECKIEWVEDIVNQCRLAHVPVFVKQLNINGVVVKDINRFPDHLRIREFPRERAS